MLNQSIDNDVSWKSPFGLKINLHWPPLILTRSCSPGQFVKPGQCTIRFALTAQPSISGAFMGCCSGSVCWRGAGASTPLWTVDLRPLPPPGSLPPNPPLSWGWESFPRQRWGGRPVDTHCMKENTLWTFSVYSRAKNPSYFQPENMKSLLLD